MNREKLLAKYDNVFKNEKNYYGKSQVNINTNFDLDNEDFFKLAYQKFKNILGNIKGKKILDIGCGNGALSFYLARKGAKVTGIDLSNNFIEACQKAAKSSNLNLEFESMNAQIPDFDDDVFDIVVGLRVIHHLPNIELFFKECKRILKKKGFIVFIEPLKKNVIVELNRKFFAPAKRTRYEHPLNISDLEKAEEIFNNIEHYEFFLLSPLARFFQNFIKKKQLFKISYKFLNIIEKPICKIKRIKPYCWQTVFKCVKL